MVKSSENVASDLSHNASGDPAIELRDVTIAYDQHPIVHHVTGSFGWGALTAVVGPNGAGKSTLLKAIAGLVPLRSGQLVLPASARRQLSFLPQAAEVDRQFPLSVIDVVNFGHWREVGAFGRIGPERRRRSLQAVAQVGLGGNEGAPIAHLSLGQLQRTLFARLIVQDSPIILLDEPFNGIDADTTNHLTSILKGWSQEGRAVIAALHDIEQVRRLFPTCLVMAREMVAWGPTREVLNRGSLDRAQALAKAWNDPAEICRYVA